LKRTRALLLALVLPLAGGAYAAAGAAPAEPAEWRTYDLLVDFQQLQGTLLAGLALHVTVADFNCSAAHPSFALTLNAPLAVPPASRQAQAAGAAPRS
jgi:hypothetical protein